MEVRKNLKKWLVTLSCWLVIASLLIPAFPVSAAEPTQAQINAGISKAVNYLRTQQANDGGISNPSVSGWSAIAFASAGLSPQAIKKTRGIPTTQQRSLMDYLKNYSQTALKNPGLNVLATDYARQILAAYTIEPYPHALGGVNLLKQLGNFYDSDAKQFVHPQYGGAYVNDDIFSIIGYSASAAMLSENYKYIGAVNFLLGKQNADGGFSWSANSTASDVDDTAAALQALVLAKKAEITGLDTAIQHAYDYLKTNQNADGGFPYDPSDTFWGGNQSNASSTAWSVQAIVAYKGKADLVNFVKNGNDPIGYLLSLQKPDGSYGGWDGSSDPYTTSLVIPALAKRPWPIRWNRPKAQAKKTRLSIHATRTKVKRGKRILIFGHINPSRRGTLVLHYKRGNSSWRTAKKIRAQGTRYRTKVRISSAKRYVFYVTYGSSKSRRIVVRGLR